MRHMTEGLEAAREEADESAETLVTAVDRLLHHADYVRRLRVRANADTADDGSRARTLGAQGIGLCRTEHMFLGDRRPLIEAVILADTAEQLKTALDTLLPLQRADFEQLLASMEDRKSTRLNSSHVAIS